MLLRLAGEAGERQVAIQFRAERETSEDFANRLGRVRAAMLPVVSVHGQRGEFVGGTTASILEPEQLPVRLVRIEFDSAFSFRNQAGVDPLNYFRIALDFRRPRVFDGLFGFPDETNESEAHVAGADTTWVNGVVTELREFFSDRTTRRDWLHMPQSYGVAALFGIPLALYWVYWIDRWPGVAGLGVTEALKVALYVYIALIFMLAYRITFNVARRTFAKLEGPERQTRSIWLQRTPLGVLMSGLLANVIVEIVKLIARLFGRS